MSSDSETIQYEVSQNPTDGISSMRIIDNKWLLVSSWDTSVRLYDVTNGTLKNTFNHKAGVLDCCFSDKYHAFSGGIDRSVKSFDLSASSETTLGTHDKPVRALDYSKSSNTLISGGWDSVVKLWDTRSRTPCVGTIQQPDKVFTMSVSPRSSGDYLVVGTGGRHVMIYDLRYTSSEPLQRRESSLKYQTRCIRCYPDGNGYALSSIEGRVAMEYFDPSPIIQSKKYAFKCHRITQSGIDTVYPVNSIAFNEKYGTFATGGCEGSIYVWDGENKKRLAQFTDYPTSISALAFTEDASLLAIASSYTFEEGEKDHPPDQIFIRKVKDYEVRPKVRAEAPPPAPVY